MQSGCGLHVREERSKQMKKRMVILSLTMVLAMGVSACGSQPAEAPADAAAPAAEAAQEASEQTGDGYVVLVMDEENAPVPGATVQFCSDTLCMTGETDETGIASFDQEPGQYTVHVLRAPEGYVVEDTEYEAPAEPGIVTIVLSREEAEPDSAEAEAGDDVMDIPELGFYFDTPAKYKDVEGYINWGSYYLDAGIQAITTAYYAVPAERINEYVDYMDSWYKASMSGEDAPEAPEPSWMSGYEHADLYEIYTINENRGKDELLAAIEEDSGMTEADYSLFEEIGSDADCTFFLARSAEFENEKSQYEETMGEFFAECSDLYEDKDSFLSAMKLSAPEWPQTLKIGDEIFYESSDLDGNPLRSKAIFSEAKVTMINLWATWCGPCKNELPELAEMAKEFEEQDCQIIGVVMDADNEEKAALAKELLSAAGAEYLNLWGEDYVMDVFPIEAYPTTIFVDREGRILIEPIVGADPDGYREGLKKALRKVKE